MNYEVKKEEWADFFVGLSKRRFEWMTEIEVIGNNLGDQTLSNGLPLAGITMENKGDKVEIAISVGETPENHLTHTIKDPTRVAFLEANGDKGDVIDIEEEDGTKTLIRLIEPMGVLVGFAAYRTESAAVLF